MPKKNGSPDQSTAPVVATMTRDNFLDGSYLPLWDAIAKRAESPAELLMLPSLLCVCLGLVSALGVERITVCAQDEIEGLGRVDWSVLIDGCVGVVLEVDGLAYHSSQEDFANDRQRDRAALRGGWVTVRFTAKELAEGGWYATVELHNTLWNLVKNRRQLRKELVASPAVAALLPGEPHVQ